MDIQVSQMRKDYADLDAGRLHFATGGTGDPLLMIHSTPRTHRQFQLLFPVLTQRFSVLAPDTFGFGQSDPLQPGARFENLATGLVMLLDRLGIERTHVYGFHTGNKIAAALAMHHPERVGRLILSGQTHSLIPNKEKRDRAIRAIVDKYFVESRHPRSGRERQWTVDLGIISSVWGDAKMLGMDDPDGAAMGTLERYVADYIFARHSLVPIYEANFSFDFETAARAIAAPTLIVEFATLQEEHLGRQAEELAAIMHRATTVTYENTGGNAHDTRAPELCDTIVRFLES